MMLCCTCLLVVLHVPVFDTTGVVGADAEELDEAVLDYLAGYVAECAGSGESGESFIEGFRELLEVRGGMGLDCCGRTNERAI